MGLGNGQIVQKLEGFGDKQVSYVQLFLEHSEECIQVDRFIPESVAVLDHQCAIDRLRKIRR